MVHGDTFIGLCKSRGTQELIGLAYARLTAKP